MSYVDNMLHNLLEKKLDKNEAWNLLDGFEYVNSAQKNILSKSGKNSTKSLKRKL